MGKKHFPECLLADILRAPAHCLSLATTHNNDKNELGNYQNFFCFTGGL